MRRAGKVAGGANGVNARGRMRAAGCAAGALRESCHPERSRRISIWKAAAGRRWLKSAPAVQMEILRLRAASTAREAHISRGAPLRMTAFRVDAPRAILRRERQGAQG